MYIGYGSHNNLRNNRDWNFNNYRVYIYFTSFIIITCNFIFIFAPVRSFMRIKCIDEIANYRPISLLSCVSKLLERIVSDPLTDFLTENKIIGPQQFGFTKGTSAIDQLLEVYFNIVSTLDKQMIAKFIFLDVSKAFDKVWRKGLIHKLKRYGVRGSLLGWFESYLEDRLKRVVLKGYFSTWRSIMAGVPQGSILGPLLYLVYAEDMKERILCGLRSFADDTLLFAMGLTEKQCADQLQPGLDALGKWAKEWKIKLNPLKTKCITFSHVASLRYPLMMDSMFILEVMTHKHLGLHLSHDGKWNNHYQEVNKKVMRRLAVLKRYSWKLSRTSLANIYYSFIRPMIEYGGAVTTNLTAADEDMIEEFQRSAIRAITGCKAGTSHVELLREMDEKPLAKRRRVASLSKFFSIRSEDRPCHLNSTQLQLVSERNQHARRRRDDYTVYKTNTEQFKSSFLPVMIKEWNALDETTRSAQSVKSFKNQLQHKPKPPAMYSVEYNRASAIHMARLRCRNSNLNYNLFGRQMAESPECDVCGDDETDVHYFERCQRFNDARTEAKARVPHLEWRTSMIYHGSELYSTDDNCQIQLAGQFYIDKTKRFD